MMSKQMGVKMHSDSSDSFDMLRELEIARSSLHHKQQQMNSSVVIEEINDVEADNNLLLEWVLEE